MTLQQSNEEISQRDLLIEYFKHNPNKDISHREMRDWINDEYIKRTGKRFEDPDRGVRSLSQKGFLRKIRKGVYRYEPGKEYNKELHDFTAKQKEEIFKNDDYTCVMCGRSPKKDKGIELHADHIIPKDQGGPATIENGQTLCSRDNFIKKNLNQTTTGKKMFINLYNLAKSMGEKEVENFCADLLDVYEKYEMNGHIKWTK